MVNTEADGSPDENQNLNDSIRRNAKANENRKLLRLRTTNRGLKGAVVVLAVIVLILIAVVIFKHRNGHRIQDFNTCNTQVCKETAKELFLNLDLKIDPCEDFYNFSCGGWIKRNPRPANENFWSVHTQLSERLNKRLIDVLEDVETFHHSSVRKAQNFFAACNNLEYREEFGIEDMKILFKRIGGFPLIQKDWKGDNYDWIKAYVYADTHLDSIQPIFEYEIGETLAGTPVLKLHSPYKFEIGVESQFRGTEEEKKGNETAFRNKIKRRLAVLGVDISDAQIDKDITDIIEFDKNITRLAVQGIRTSMDFRKFTLGEAQGNFTGVDILKIFNDIFSISNIHLEPGEPMFVQNFHHYFMAIGNILKSTPKRIIANYIGWKVINHFGVKVLLPLWRQEKENVTETQIKQICYSQTEDNFVIAVNHMFVQKYYSNESLSELRSFLKQLKSSLTLTLQNNHWMDDSTKIQAQLKLNKMLDYIASPEWITSDKDVDIVYENTGPMSSENYVNDYKKMSKWKKSVQLALLRSDKPQSLTFKPSIVNAYYRPSENKIYILTSVLQPPYYYKDAPLALNFGGIGSVIGHEITHGFDVQGSRYDHTGKPRNWWANGTMQMFQEKVKCFVAQYSNYTEPLTGLQVDGQQTIKDNIADNGGVNQAYEAFKIYSAVKHPEKDLKLPLEMNRFTTEQLYFIAFANQYCASFTKGHQEMLLKLDDHAPFEARVMLPLANSKDFSKAFKCKEGSRMNPKEKCHIW